MSIEYTIDIQLTELGFPDVVQPREPSGRETPRRSTSSDDKYSDNHAATSLTATHKQSLLVRVQQSVDGIEAGVAKQTSNAETVRSKPAQSTQDEQVDQINLDPQQLIIVEGDSGDRGGDEATQGQEDDSDGSDVSEMCEEEELDEDDYDDEEGLNNETSHSGDFRCSVCNLQLHSKFKLQDHMNLHTGARPYCCAECGKRFCQIYNYRVHLRTHAGTKVDRLMCRVCRMGFASQEDLDAHLSRTHFEDEFYECDLCKRVFTSLKACENHVQLHKYAKHVVCEVCGRNFSSVQSLARHRRRRCHHHFKCTDCPLTFTKKNALLKHSFSHLGLLPYTCIRCRCHFRLAKLYRQHKCEPERIHCVACLREFLCQDDFQQHKKDTGCWGNQEPKVDEIRCLECGQRFDTSEELKKHAGAHQRVLKCADCGKGFRSALLLMSHMGGHAGKSPCLCQSCGLGFPHQQNYDSHLKTCGQTPQPARAPKKRQASKSFSPERKKLDAKPDSSIPTNTSTPPVAPMSDSGSPGLVTGGVSPDCGPDGLWKLTLDKEPPPGVNLVVFLPVCPNQTDGLTLPSAVSPTTLGPGMQVQPQHMGVNATLGASLIAPLDLTGIKQDAGCDAPLDLSKKGNLCKAPLSDIPLQPIKSEPDEFKISGEASDTEGQKLQDGDSKGIVKLNPGQTTSIKEKVKVDPMDVAPNKVKTTPSGPVTDFKNEPQFPGLDLVSSGSHQLTEKEET